MKIALLGFGTVAKGTYELTLLRPEHGIEVARVFVRRNHERVCGIQTYDINDILSDASIDTVAELMGGEEPAFSYVKAALRAGKNVVTANKLMLSLHYEELISLARENGVHIAFSAAVGGGIPFLASLLRVGRVDTVESLGGIMNGTTNYILTAMQQQGADFAETLKKAQELGYAEADPTADIDGLDVRAKLALSVDVAFGKMADAGAIPTLGIRHISAEDVVLFKQLGFTCRLIGKAERTAQGAAAYVEPTLFPQDAPEAGVNGTGNVISYQCRGLGCQNFYGLGAGMNPTASAVMHDLIDTAMGCTPFDLASCEGGFVPDAAESVHAYYLRTDAPVPAGLVFRTLGETAEGTAYITTAVSVSDLHAFVKETLAKGGKAFAAALA